MSWMQFSIRKDFLHNGGQTTKLDTNKDQNPEYTLNKTESGTSFEIFDFDSDGNKDMRLFCNENGKFICGSFRNENGKFICGNFWNENGEITHPENQEIMAYLDQAQELRENAKKDDCINKMREASQKMKALSNSLNTNNSRTEDNTDKDISEATFKFFN